MITRMLPTSPGTRSKLPPMRFLISMIVSAYWSGSKGPARSTSNGGDSSTAAPVEIAGAPLSDEQVGRINALGTAFDHRFGKLLESYAAGTLRVEKLLEQAIEAAPVVHGLLRQPPLPLPGQHLPEDVVDGRIGSRHRIPDRKALLS